jgi:hypothetical protein
MTTNTETIDERINISVNDLKQLLFFYNQTPQIYADCIFADDDEDSLLLMKEEYQHQLSAGKIISRILNAYLEDESIWENGKWDEEMYFILLQRSLGLEVTMEVAEECLDKLENIL